MEIRDARPSDADAVRATHSDSIEGLGTEAYSDKQVDAWAEGCESADYTPAIESEKSEFVVAEADGKVVAFGSLKRAPPEGYEADVDAEVTGVYVHPSVARDGVGTRIYEELERRARARDVRTLGLSASLNAVPFYENCGYERIREYAHEFSSHESTGVTGVVVEMKKEL
ncbi:GNAT family N-acetyltransferase [Halopelagius longus]|uniref:GNAT family N-acetyltransferase n=1 Tax=Halopelagius longus TaxID=1236180 RepID=A0A1H1G371_9EURY|nr:GNAT family N-acetyltransferase [Halopelagius longus]RDI69873.1 GNAT family N-acetyltransferase [Halopelagius longus]SDR07631.1 putative acetyltransferase [Halopelagius longus]